MEHLLRDIKDNAAGTISTRIGDQLNALKGLESQLADVEQYLSMVLEGSLPINHPILYNLQNMFNLLPNIQDPDFVRSLSVCTNDEYFSVYIASLVRGIISLHELINNKLANQEAEKPSNSSSSSSSSNVKESEIANKKKELVGK